MAEHNFNSIWKMIVEVDPDERRDYVFRCGHDQFCGLRKLVDSSGMPLVHHPFEKGGPFRLLGYQIEPSVEHGELEFVPRPT